MQQPRYVVRKQVYELTVASREDARDLHARLDLAHHQRVVSVLAEVMEEAVRGDDLLLIERLEIDLGELQAGDVEEQLAARVEERLRQKLAESIALVPGLSSPPGPARLMSIERTDLELLGAFLATGVLPWWAPLGVASLPERLDRLLEQSPRQLLAMLRGLPAGRAAPRLVKQFPARQVQRIVAMLAGSGAAAISEAIDDWASCLQAIGEGGTDGGHDGAGVAAAVTASGLAALLEGATDVAGVSERVFDRFSPTGDAEAEALLRRLADVAEIRLAAGGVRQWIALRARRGPRGTPRLAAQAGETAVAATEDRPRGDAGSSSRTGRSSDETAGGIPSDTAGEHGGRRAPVVIEGRSAVPSAAASADDGASGSAAREAEPPRRDPVALAASGPAGAVSVDPGPAPARATAPASETSSAPPAAIDPDVGLIVNNAGLVLLWPFLPRFFAELGLVEGDAFAGDPAHERAVLLLQHVVTGSTDTPEHELVVNKLLCGLAIEEPVAAGIEVTDRESREVSELLASVLENWKALGSTSAAGLRATFLQRPGTLTHQELGWNLKVARTGYDVLLDLLPWGIGLIMLPWMEEPLVVEW